MEENNIDIVVDADKEEKKNKVDLEELKKFHKAYDQKERNDECKYHLREMIYNQTNHKADVRRRIRRGRRNG